MLKLTVAVLAIALAGTAGAAGWRDLKIDGTSEAAFQQSLAAFSEELSRERNQVFTAALIRPPWAAVIIGERMPTKRASCTPLVMYCQR